MFRIHCSEHLTGSQKIITSWQKNRFRSGFLIIREETSLLRAAGNQLYPDGIAQAARFRYCGILVLLKERKREASILAVYHPGDVINNACRVSESVRRNTTAAAGTYCDCGYRKRRN